MKEIADRIKEARLAKGMTQDELAKALGLKSRSSINKMEKNAYFVKNGRERKRASQKVDRTTIQEAVFVLRADDRMANQSLPPTLGGNNEKHLSASVYGAPESVMIHIITPKRYNCGICQWIVSVVCINDAYWLKSVATPFCSTMNLKNSILDPLKLQFATAAKVICVGLRFA